MASACVSGAPSDVPVLVNRSVRSSAPTTREPPLAQSPPTPPQNPNGEVRVGLIGVGAVPQTAHLPIISKMRGASLVALCDNDGPKARAIADRFGVRDVFTDIDDLLELESLDAVVIVTPNHLHEPHVLSALRANLHVLCGRPLALSVRGVERMLAPAKKANRILQVDNHNRFRADVQALDRFLHGGELGKLTGIRAGSFQLKRELG